MEKEIFFTDIVYLFPYDKVSVGEDVIIWGYGKVGRSYLKQISVNHYCNIRYIVDKKWMEYGREKIEICSPSVIADNKDTKIIIAIKQKCSSIIDELKALGVEEKRVIHQIDCCHNTFQLQGLFMPTYYHMTLEEAIEYYGADLYNEMVQIRHLMRCDEVLGYDMVRVGASHDGGYIMVDDFVVDTTEKIAYSFGISDDVSWDSDMTAKGYDVYMYDHTIECLPVENERFHFFRKGIAASEELVDGLESLEKILSINGHLGKQNLILKMDVEGAEWGGISLTPREVLDQFDQIVMELHGVFDKRYIQRVKIFLEKINQTHQVVHVHANNYGHVSYVNDDTYPMTLEVCYVNRRRYTFIQRDIMFPIEIDSPCSPGIPEIKIGHWNK